MKLRLNRTRLRLAEVQAARVVRVRVQKTASNCDFYSKNNPDGSYTGVCLDGGEPVQDADDL